MAVRVNELPARISYVCITLQDLQPPGDHHTEAATWGGDVESRRCQQTAPRGASAQAAASLHIELLQSARHSVEHGEQPQTLAAGRASAL